MAEPTPHPHRTTAPVARAPARWAPPLLALTLAVLSTLVAIHLTLAVLA